MKSSAATMASRSMWFPRERQQCRKSTRLRLRMGDGGGMLATWNTRYAGLQPWYPGISPGNFEIIWPGVTQSIYGWLWFLSSHLGLIGVVVHFLSLAFLMETSQIQGT